MTLLGSGYGLATGWSAIVDGSGARESGDPLGIRVWANQVTAGLAPGLTNATTSVQGYGLLAAGLELFSKPGPRKYLQGLGPTEAWLRWERLWVLAQAAHAEHLPVKDVPHWRGFRQAVRFVDLDSADLTMPFLGYQLSTGSWGAYRRSAGRWGLIDATRGGRATSPADSRLTIHGYQLAKMWRERNLRVKKGWTLLQIAKVLADGTTTADEARSIFRPDRPSYVKVADATSAGLSDDHADAGRAEAALRLNALRAVFEDHPSLTARQVFRAPVETVAPHQRDLAHQAHVIGRMFASIELPYRRWLRDLDAPQPDEDMWHKPWWAIAEAHSTEARELRSAGLSTPGSWSGPQAWAERLSGRRGGQATRPGEAPAGFENAVAPALGLRSAAALFSQGFLGTPLKERTDMKNSQDRALKADDD